MDIGSSSYHVCPPAKFKGNLLQYDGGLISYDIKIMIPVEDPVSIGSGFGRIQLNGVGSNATFDCAPYPQMPTVDGWTTYHIPLTAEAWNTTQENWEKVLSNVKDFTMILDLMPGEDTLGFDNFKLQPPAQHAPAIVLNNNAVVVDFGPQHGVWVRNAGSWSKLTSVSPVSMRPARMDTEANGMNSLVADFGPLYGVWIYHPGDYTWTQLHMISPESITVANIDSDVRDDLVMDFGSQYGIWTYMNNSSWTHIHTVSSDSITAGDMDGDNIDELVIDFGAQYGIWVRNDDGNWWQLHTVSP